jgi:hypothetical protein
MRNEQIITDARKYLTGKDGRLFIYDKNGIQRFLAACDNFTATLTANTVDKQPVGSEIVLAVTTGYSISISLTESVIVDDLTLQPILTDIQNGWAPSWDFTGMLDRYDGQEQIMNYKNCVLSGELNLQKFVPGEVVDRPINFRVNALPEMLKWFEAA